MLLGATPVSADEDDPTPESSSAPDQRRAARLSYEDEPTVQALIEEALRRSVDRPRRLESTMLRARRSGWVPIVRFRARHAQGNGLGTYFYTDSSRVNLNNNSQLAFEASLSFHLDRVVYHPNESQWYRLVRDAAVGRRVLVETIIKLYFERRRLQIEEALASQPVPSRQLRILELQVRLDTLTADRFRAQWQSTSSSPTPTLSQTDAASAVKGQSREADGSRHADPGD